MCNLPGETVEDYEKEIQLLRQITHLRPPIEIALFTLQRFTPYFEAAQQYGMTEVRALDGYRAVFPFDQEALDTLAYHFEFRFADGRPPDATERIADLLGEVVRSWKKAYGKARLDSVPVPGGRVVIDTRFKDPTVFVFEGLAMRIMSLLDEPKAPVSILRDSEIASWDPSAEDVFGALLGPNAERPILRAARRVASPLAARVTWVPSPFALGLPESEERRIEELERFLAGLAAAGLTYTEAGRSISLAVPRQEVPAIAHPTPLAAAAVVA